MEITRRLLQLKDHAEKTAREADRAEGALASLRKEMQKEFGISTLKQAKRKSGELRAQIDALDLSLLQEVERIEREMGPCTV